MSACTGQCVGCAFGKNDGAGSEVANRLKGLICAYGARVFWCHHGRDGEEYDWKESKLGPYLLAPRNRKPCAGWKRYVAELKRRGYFSGKDFLFIRKFIAERALVALDRFTSKTLPAEEKEAARVVLHESTKFIFAKDIGNLEIPL